MFVCCLFCGGWLCGVCFLYFEVSMVWCFCVFGAVANVLNCVLSQFCSALGGVLFLFIGVWKVWFEVGPTSPNPSFFGV